MSSFVWDTLICIEFRIYIEWSCCCYKSDKTFSKEHLKLEIEWFSDCRSSLKERGCLARDPGIILYVCNFFYMGRIFGFQILLPKITSEKPKYLTNMYQAHHIELACCLILKLKFMWNKSKYIQITKYFKVVAKLAFKRLLQVKVKVWIEVSIFVYFKLKLWRWSEVKATKWKMVWFLYILQHWQRNI